MKNLLLIIVLSLFTSISFSQSAAKYQPKNGNHFVNFEKNSFTARKSKSDSIYFYESFETDTLLLNWKLVDADGDSSNWIADISPITAPDGKNMVMSYSWDGGALTPENWLISPVIDLSNASGVVIVEFYALGWGIADFKEHFSLKLSTSDDDTASFTTTLIDDEEIGKSKTWTRYYANLTQYIGDTIHLAWIHHNCTDQYILLMDDISVEKNTFVDAAITEVISPSNKTGCMLSSSENATITLFNNGGEPISDFSVKYLIPGEGLVSETVTDTIQPMESMDYTFSQTMDFSTLGYYPAILFMLNLSGDEVNTNNSMYTDVSSTDAKIKAIANIGLSPGAGWNLTNSADSKIAEHDYPGMFVAIDTINVCVLADDCYIMDFTGSYGAGWVEVFYNDTLVGGNQDAGSAFNGITIGGIGNACAGLDLELSEISITPYQLTGNVEIKGYLRNRGTDTITSADLNYSIDGGTTYTDNINDTIAAGNRYRFRHATPAFFYSAGDYEMKMWVSNVNGTTDEVNTNDTMNFTFHISGATSAKRVLIEEGTGAWCGWCPDGAVIMDEILESETRVIGVAIHNGDSMSFEDGNTILSNYAQGYPSGSVDRHLFTGASTVGLSRDQWAPAANISMNSLTPLSVALSSKYDTATRIVTIDVTADFQLDASGDYRLNCYIVEDSVSGTGSGWDQKNSLNTQTGHPMAGLGNPIVGYVHRHVARAFLGGPWGTANIIPSSVTAGQSFSIQYTDTLNENWNADNISIIGLVQKYGSTINERDIVNVHEAHLGKSTVSIKKIEKAERQISVYPNPAKDLVRIENVENAQIDLYTIYGRLVKHVPLAGHTQDINIKDLSRGTYIIRVSDENGITTKKLVVLK